MKLTVKAIVWSALLTFAGAAFSQGAGAGGGGAGNSGGGGGAGMSNDPNAEGGTSSTSNPKGSKMMKSPSSTAQKSDPRAKGASDAAASSAN